MDSKMIICIYDSNGYCYGQYDYGIGRLQPERPDKNEHFALDSADHSKCWMDYDYIPSILALLHKEACEI